MRVQRRRYANQNDIRFIKFGKIGSGAKSFALDHSRNGFAGNTANRRLTIIQRSDFCGIDVKTDYAKACFVHGARQRQTDISQPNNPNNRLASVNLCRQRTLLLQPLAVHIKLAPSSNCGAQCITDTMRHPLRHIGMHG